MRRLALALAALAVSGVLPTAAGAVLPGPNGPLVFTSGRDDGMTTLSDVQAQIWFLSGPGGSAQRLTTPTLSHHRHASWSPDRTKIAYARGPMDNNPFDGPWDIFVHDLSVPGSAPVNITNTLDDPEDRPSWSPDGTRLAYAKKDPTDSNWDVVTRAADGTGTETLVANLASTGAQGSGQFSRPQWSPDGQTIFYGKIIVVTPQNYDIYRAPADGSDPDVGGTPVVVGSTNDYQPALSADGTKLCFTRQAANKDVYVHLVGTMGIPAPLLTATTDEYECAWSPDGDTIAFVRGGFDQGHILMKDFGAPVSDLPNPVTDVAGRFDGNPEWTRNPPPTCSNGNASVPFNSFQTIPLACADDPDPPTYQPPELELQIVTQPTSGTLGGIQEDNSVIYTPNANFQGTDSFSFTGFDQTTTSPPATVTINVAGPLPDVTASDISDVTVSPLRWRRGPDLPRFSARTGTRIQWRLSEAARVTLSFQRARPGRRVRGRCVRPTRARRARPRCTRFVSVRPTLNRPNAQAGLNTLRFQGRLSPSKRLPLGRYRVVAGAVDAAGNRSAPERSRTFRIVAR